MENLHERRALPEGWEWERLGEVCEKSEYGYTTSAKSDGTGPLFLRTTDISDGDIHWQSVPFCAEPPTDEERYRLKDGDILIARAGSVGASVIIRNPPRSIFASYLIRFRPKEELNPSYAGFFLKSNLYWAQLGSKTSGTTLPGVNATNLSKVKIPLPPLPTQRCIVSILEKAEEAKRLRAQADELTDRLLQSVFMEMFGDPIINNKNWAIKNIEELSSEIVDCPHSTPNYVDYVTDFPCIRTTELREGYIDWKQMKYLDEEEYIKRVKRLIPIRDDVIYGREGSFGEAIRVPDKTKISLGQRVMLFRPKSGVCNSVFLWALLRSKSIYFQASRKTSGSTVGHVNIKDIKKFKGVCPPIGLQNKFARVVEKVETMRQSQNQSKQQIEDLFSALMQKAFRGEI